MTHDPSDDDDGRVGYGRPPRHTRWKKGQSGNPSGKRTRDESLLERLSRIVREEIAVTQNGSQTVMPQVDAMLRAAVTKSMKGDMTASKLLLEYLAKTDSVAASVPELVPGAADLEVLKTHAEWIGILEQAEAEHRAAGTAGSDAAEDAEDGHADF